MFEKEWDHKIHSYNHPGMVLGGRHRGSVNKPALTYKPYDSQEYGDATGVPHKERKKEKHHRHQEHFDSEDNSRFPDLDHAMRLRPHHSYADVDNDIKYQHGSNDLHSDHHQHSHSKPRGLRASKRNNVEFDAGHPHGRPKAPGVGYRSIPSKTVQFPDEVDDRPVRKQFHHYPKYGQDYGRHSTKKSTDKVSEV